MNSKISFQQSIEQERASVAWDCVQRMLMNPNKKEYGQLAKRAPADIQISGLGQTLAFWKAKGENYHRQLFKDVSDRVIHYLKIDVNDKEDLLVWIMKRASTDQYRLATAEAIAFLGWVKRFAEAELME